MNTTKYLSDAQQLADGWQKFVADDKELEHVHPAPGLSLFFAPLIAAFLNDSQGANTDDVFASMMELVSRSILFGMHLQRQSFDYSKLTKCPCLELDNKDEEALLNGN